MPLPRDLTYVEPSFGPKSNGGLAFHKESESEIKTARQQGQAVEKSREFGSDRPNFLDLGNEMAQQILNAVLQSCR